MDFQQLMKQASANQTSVQRKHELKKKQVEEMKKREEEEKREKVKKASARLQSMKKDSEKKQLQYRGIVNSRAAEFEKTAVKSSSSVCSSASSGHRKAKFDRATPTNGTHRPSTTISSQRHTPSGDSASSKPAGPLNPAKGKKKMAVNSEPTLTQKTTTAASSVSKPTKTSTATARPSTSASPHTPSSSSCTSRHPKPPVNFQDLMKLAEKKVVTNTRVKSGDGPEEKDAVGSVPGRNISKVGKNSFEKLGRGAREDSPLGKLLLEKSCSRSKHRKMVSGCEDGVSGETKGSRGGSEQRECTGSSKVPAVTNQSPVRNNLRELAQSRVVGRGAKTSTSNNRQGQKEKAGTACSTGKNQRLPESAILMRERFRRELEASTMGNGRGGGSNTQKPSVKSNSFYGGAHAQLSQEGRPRFPSKRPPAGLHQSSWVSEMSEYMDQWREEEEEGYSDEEEEDLEGFVVDDEDGDDVSSAIREIFGYDKRKYRDEGDDDRMMESSFAQQQYEEMRSSRIGRQEDAEDVKREAERLSRKRRKGLPTNSGHKGLKQSKLSFR